jgi:predicted metal-binding membrane protein
MAMATTTNQPVSPPIAPGVAERPRVGPQVPAIAAIVVLAALGWVYLGLMVGTAVQAGQGLGPGLLDLITAGRLDAAGRALWTALCRPSWDHAGHAMASGAGVGDFALVMLMWSAMTFAMMLPTAGPMVLTYAEIAETAAEKGERLVSPLVIVAGYVSVWLGFAVAASVLQWALMRLALIDHGLIAASGLFSGAVFIGAGAYQFSGLKHACVTVCQRPFPYLFSRWSTEVGAVFRLGLQQGLFCLGCCWAMMLVMFAVGVMNVVWMAALGVIMAAEKSASTTRLSRLVGVVLIGIGAVFIVSSVIAHWPRT